MIRQATLDDIPVIAHMLRLLHEESPFYNDVPIDEAHVLGNLHALLTRDDIVFLTEPGQGFIIGQIGTTWYDPRVRLVEQLVYCLPVWRGMGGFVRLIKAFERAGVEGGAHKIVVGVTTGINNEELAGVYERLGYARSGITLNKVIGD